MGLKYHTIIFVPHARAKFRKWRVSSRQVRIVCAAVLAVTLAAGYITWSYFVTSVDLEELAQLQRENEELRTVNESVEQSVRTLQHQLAQYEDRTKELAIVAGLESMLQTDGEVSTRGSGIGGTDPADSYRGTPYDLSLVEARSLDLEETLDRVEEKLGERLEHISATPAIKPVRGIFTSGFGYRLDPIKGHRTYHRGVDISAPAGKEVLATADGIVTRAGPVGGLGRAVYLAHGFGFATRYGHMSKILVSPGQEVKRGDVLGLVGTTGRSTGYHLHYEVLVDNKQVNPLIYILDDQSNRS